MITINKTRALVHNSRALHLIKTRKRVLESLVYKLGFLINAERESVLFGYEKLRDFIKTHNITSDELKDIIKYDLHVKYEIEMRNQNVKILAERN